MMDKMWLNRAEAPMIMLSNRENGEGLTPVIPKTFE